MGYGPGYYPMMGEGGGWHMFGVMHSMLWYVLLIVAIVVLLLLVRRVWSGGETDTALRLLKERYARGEIEREEFQQRKRDLA